jgi:hypothetical protein
MMQAIGTMASTRREGVIRDWGAIGAAVRDLAGTAAAVHRQETMSGGPAPLAYLVRRVLDEAGPVLLRGSGGRRTNWPVAGARGSERDTCVETMPARGVRP